MKVVPVTCLYAGKPELKEKVEEAIRVHQNNDRAVAFGVAAALILERALLGKGMPDDDLVASLDPSVQDAWNKATSFDDIETLVQEAGRSCALPGSFIAPVFLFQQAGTENAYATALRANILAAGDTCSRAVFVGSVLAAANQGVPEDWVAKMDKETLKRIDAAAEKIADLVAADLVEEQEL